MDLKDLTPKNDDVLVEIVHPVTREPILKPDGTQMSLTLMNPYSKEYREVMYERTDVRLEEAQKSGSTKVKAKDADMASIDTLARITKDWNIHYDGEEPKLSINKAKKIYDDLRWMKLQAEEALENQEAFT